MLFVPFQRKTYEKLTSPLDDVESRKGLMDTGLGEGSSRASEETVMSVMGWQQRTPKVRTYAALSLSLAITNIFTLGLWLSSLYRMNSWLMEDYYNRPEIEYLGQAQIPVQYETRRFHTGIVAGDKKFSNLSSSTADTRFFLVGLTRLTTDQAYHLGEETSKEWNKDDSYVGVLSAFHQNFPARVAFDMPYYTLVASKKPMEITVPESIFVRSVR